MPKADDDKPPPSKAHPWPVDEALKNIEEYAATLRELVRKLKARLLH
ncbi:MULTISPECIES: hypothetical protein [unclassified Bradyrhizobium]